MKLNLRNLVLILSMAKTFTRNNPYYTFVWLFMRYVRHRFDYLSSRQTRIQSISDKIHSKLVKILARNLGHYVDYKTCAMGKLEDMESDIASWYNFCSKVTHRKYKVLIVPYDNFEEGKIIISETMRFNLENLLQHPLDEASYFVMPGNKEEIQCAAEARISLICNPYDCPNVMIDCLLETYFRIPRYLIVKDLFGVDLKEYAPDYFYSSANPNLTTVYFRVNALRIKHEGQIQGTTKVCYVVKGETSLVQEANVHSYLPREFTEAIDVDNALSLREKIDMCRVANFPPSLEKSMETLRACISPFLQKG